MNHCGVLPGVDGSVAYASEPLQHIMYKGYAAVGGGASIKNPGEDLMKLLCAALPYYKDLCGIRWRAHVLLVANGFCVGLAFLEGVYRFSAAIGPAKFPAGSL